MSRLYIIYDAYPRRENLLGAKAFLRSQSTAIRDRFNSRWVREMSPQMRLFANEHDRLNSIDSCLTYSPQRRPRYQSLESKSTCRRISLRTEKRWNDTTRRQRSWRFLVSPMIIPRRSTNNLRIVLSPTTKAHKLNEQSRGNQTYIM